MKCPLESDQPERLLDYVAQRLSQTERVELHFHVASCDACRRWVDGQREVWSALDEWKPVEASTGFNRSVYAQVAREQQSDWMTAWWHTLAARWSMAEFRPAMAMAALCVVTAAGMLVYSRASQPETTEASQAPSRMERVDLEQVERALDDVELLKNLGTADATHSSAM